VEESLVPSLAKHTSSGGRVLQLDPSTWRLEVPAGPAGNYRLAQLDDYAGLSRVNFLNNPPLKLSLRARASSQVAPGTWGFGFWNDPFGMTLIRGTQFRLPVLPNAVWFFFASSQNHISLHDDLPGNGQLYATFKSPARLPAKLALSIPLLPLVVIPPVARWLRKIGSQYIQQDALLLNHDSTTWHLYEIEWRSDQVVCYLDGNPLLQTGVVPHGPLGLVVWIDNQYASLPPDGHVAYGTQANGQRAWIEVNSLHLTLA
jgi:hypothetical protein